MPNDDHMSPTATEAAAASPAAEDVIADESAGPTADRAVPTMPERLLLVGSSGGHLAQLMALEGWWSAKERTWVTFPTPDARSRLRDEDVVWAHFPTTRSIKNLLRNLLLAFRVIRVNRPDIIVSTGAGVAFPFFLVAWLYRTPTVYLEVYDRLDTPTLTGRLCRPLSTLFCVQWEEQRVLYKNATVVGTLL